MLIVDAHAHIYSADEKRYPPIEKPLRPPPGTGTVERLRQEMESAGVSRAVLIQTSTFYRWDNRLILDTVTSQRQWCTGVVTVDPDAPHSADILFAAVRKYGVRGLRSIPAADGNLDHPGVRRLWQEARNLRIVVNCLIGDKLELVPQLSRMLRDFSDLPVVQDHCLMMDAGQKHDDRLKAMLELSRHRNLHAKLTFIPMCSAQEYPFRDLHDAAKRIIQAFGPDRCVWGSDFPLQLWAPKCTYQQHVNIFTHELGLSAQEQEAILGKTATRLWFQESADLGVGGAVGIG